MSKHSKAQECEARTSALVDMDRGMDHQLRLSGMDWRPEIVKSRCWREVYLVDVFAA